MTEKSLLCKIYRYVGSPSAIVGKPIYAIFSGEPSGSDWVLAAQVQVNFEDNSTQNQIVQATVAAIEKDIQKRRMDLEEDLQELTNRKKDLLSLTYNVVEA
jgi:hypothetical protein